MSRPAATASKTSRLVPGTTPLVSVGATSSDGVVAGLSQTPPSRSVALRRSTSNSLVNAVGRAPSRSSTSRRSWPSQVIAEVAQPPSVAESASRMLANSPVTAGVRWPMSIRKIRCTRDFFVDLESGLESEVCWAA